jgi:hypothetical protein
MLGTASFASTSKGDICAPSGCGFVGFAITRVKRTLTARARALSA